MPFTPDDLRNIIAIVGSVSLRVGEEGAAAKFAALQSITEKAAAQLANCLPPPHE